MPLFNKKSSLICFVSLALLGSTAFADLQQFGDWVKAEPIPEPADDDPKKIANLKEFYGYYKDVYADMPFPVEAKADFDGNGLIDTAQVMVNQKNGASGLFVLMQYKEGFDTFQLNKKSANTGYRSTIIGIAPPAYYQIWCTKENRNCTKTGEQAVKLKNPLVSDYTYGKASSVYYWAEHSQTFEETLDGAD